MSLKSFLLTLILTIMLSISRAFIYDYLVLSLQWSPALCRAQPQAQPCTINPAPFFGVHGLWPNVFQGNDPKSCGRQFRVSFDRNVVTGPPLEPDLNNIWPNYLGSSNIDFWRYEWNKHCSCAYEVFDERQYFSYVIDVYNHIDIDSFLSSQGINPDFNMDYKLPSFKQTIADEYAWPQIVCSGGVNGIPLEIKEIKICLNDLGTEFIDCPRPDSNCGTKVKWYI